MGGKTSQLDCCKVFCRSSQLTGGRLRAVPVLCPIAMAAWGGFGPVAARNPNGWNSRNLSIVNVVSKMPLGSRIWPTASQASHSGSSIGCGKPASSVRDFFKAGLLAPVFLIFVRSFDDCAVPNGRQWSPGGNLHRRRRDPAGELSVSKPVPTASVEATGVRTSPGNGVFWVMALDAGCRAKCLSRQVMRSCRWLRLSRLQRLRPISERRMRLNRLLKAAAPRTPC